MKKVFSIALALAMICGASAFAQNKDNKTCKGNRACTEQAGGNNKMYQPRTFTEFAFEGILLTPEQQTRIDSLNQATKAQCEAARAERQGNKECKKADCKKADCKKADCKKADCKKADCKKADCKKADCKKADCKKDSANCKKANCPKDSTFCKNGKGMKDGRKGMKDGRRGGMCPPGVDCKAYAGKVKEILTPDQYVMFLENISINAPQNDGKKCPTKDGAKAKKAAKNNKSK